MNEPENNFCKLPWLEVFNRRAKKLVLDFTSVKNWFAVWTVYGFFKWDHFDSWAFVLLILSILGIKEAVSIILAFRGVPEPERPSYRTTLPPMPAAKPGTTIIVPLEGGQNVKA